MSARPRHAVLILAAVTCFAHGSISHVANASDLWTQTTGPPGGAVTALASLETDVLAGTRDGGVYRSLDSGASWSKSENGLPPIIQVTALAVAGRDVFLGTSEDGVFRSLDFGESWSPASSGLPEAGVRQLVVGNGRIFVLNATFLNGASVSGTLFVTTDDGDSWQPTGAPTPFLAIAAVGDTLFGASDAGIGILRSLDNGANWELPDPGSPVSGGIFSAFTISAANIFAGRLGQTAIVRTTDLGETWTTVNGDIPDNLSVNALGVDGSIVYAALSNVFQDLPGEGLYRSADQGGSWSQLEGSPTGQGRLINSINSDGTNVFIGTEKGVYRSDDSGETWSNANSGLIATQSQALIATESSLFGTVAHLPSGASGLFVSKALDLVFRSSDDGASWSAEHSGLPDGSEIICLASKETLLFAGTDEHGVFRSTDGGVTWEVANNGLPEVLAIDGSHYREINRIVVSGDTLLAGTGTDVQFIGGQLAGGGIYRSDDNGASWVATNDGLPIIGFTDPQGDPLYPPISGMVASGTMVFAGTVRRGIFRSTDMGGSWSEVNTGLPQDPGTGVFPWLVGFEFLEGDVFAVARGFAIGFGEGSGVFRSSNAGLSWTEVSTGLPIGRPVNAVAVGCEELFVAMGCSNLTINNCFPDPFDGIYSSVDHGDTWQPFGTGLDGVSIGPLAVKGINLFAGTLRFGVWNTPIGTDANDNGVPDECEAPPCPWDLDDTGTVGLSDLLSLLASWGPCEGCPADFDDSGDVGLSDLLALLANWGPCP